MLKPLIFTVFVRLFYSFDMSQFDIIDVLQFNSHLSVDRTRKRIKMLKKENEEKHTNLYIIVTRF